MGQNWGYSGWNPATTSPHIDPAEIFTGRVDQRANKHTPTAPSAQ